MTSIEIYNRIADLKEAAALAVKEERAQDAWRIDGQIAELDAQLQTALKVEDEMRAEGMTPVTVTETKAEPMSIAQAFLGPRDAFRGLPLEGEQRVPISNAVTVPGNPVRTEPGIPGIQLEQHMFLDTLAKGTTDADIRYLQAVSYTNAANVWTSGTKAESSYTWTEATAPLTTIAHQTPVLKRMLQHYGQLESVINNELLIGLENRKDQLALFANVQNGMQGVTRLGQSYTAQADDNLYDAIRRMKTLSMTGSGCIPTHVAFAPAVAEAIDLLKTDGGDYLRVSIDGRYWNLPAVEDVNLAVTTTVEQVTTTNSGILVYANTAATWFTSEANEITVGTVANQFIENARTILAESENALMVTHPRSFVYFANAVTETA